METPTLLEAFDPGCVEELEPAEALDAAPDELPEDMLPWGYSLPLTPADAEDLLRRINRAQADIDRIRANAEAMIRDRERVREHLLAKYEAPLREFLAGQLTGKRRSWRCLEGVLGFRATPARLTVVEGTAALAWAREHRPEAVVTRVDARRLGKPEEFAGVDEGTGERVYQAPPGCEIEPERETFYVKTGTKAGA